MGLDAYCGKIEAPSSATTQATTDPGFTPKAVILYCVDRTSDGSAAHATMGFGFSMSASSDGHRTVATRVEDNASYPAAGTEIEIRENASTNACITLEDYQGNMLIDAHVDSFDANGFTLDFRTTSNGLDIHYIALGGSDITNVESEDFTHPAGETPPYDQFVTPGFQPDLVLFLGAQGQGSSGSFTHAVKNIGAAKSSSEQWATCTYGENMNQSDFGGGLRTDKCIQQWYVDETLYYQASYKGKTGTPSDGFEVTWDTIHSSNSYNISYLALKGTFECALGSDDQKTTGTPPVSHEISLSFEGLVALFASLNKATTTSRIDDARFSFGTGHDNTHRGCTFDGVEDSASTSNASQDSDTTQLLKMMTENGSSPSTQAELDFASDAFDSNSMNLEWDSLDSTAREFTYLVLGAEAAAAGDVFFENRHSIEQGMKPQTAAGMSGVLAE